VMDRLRPLLDEGDVKLHPLVRLIGNGADLLLLIRGQRVPGALCLPGMTQKDNRRGTQNCDAVCLFNEACWEAGGQMIQRRNTCIISSF